MKKLLIVITGIFIIFAGCEKEEINENFQDDPTILNIDGKWKVVSYENFEKGSITLKTDVDSWNGMDVILTFSVDSLYGQNTTNIVNGKYSLAGRYINIISYGGTKVGQPEWGNMFNDCVYRLRSFEVNRNQLRFYWDDSEKSVTLKKE